MNEDPKPLHEQAYHAVLESQQAARRRELRFIPATGVYASSSSAACIGGFFGMIFFVFHFANEMANFWMIITMPVLGIAVGAALGIAFSKAWRITKAVPVMIYRGIKMAIKGIPREPPV